ncbi:hypothetical protein [Cognaticolwellia mytili]|uniref:hypothetical protein n=1 Tax=Cognaticolwellia mytili TaxID=1888913 RepID=UPI000A16E432|nr:hypothetical protein [Cognaticolwellia mytili]
MLQAAYKKGYKYQLVETYQEHIPLQPLEDIKTKYITLTKDGLLTIRDGYAWDGPSGPTIDTDNFMRGSLVHDALYQLMRMNLLDREVYRIQADKLLRLHCKQDGMTNIRAQYVCRGLRIGGEPASRAENKKKVYRSPNSKSIAK